MRRMCLAGLLVLGCKSDREQAPVPTPAKPEPVAAPEPEPPTPRAGPVVLPKAIPALASAVAVARGKAGLSDAFALVDPLSGSKDEHAPVASAFADYLSERFGVRIDGVHQATVFLLPGEAGAAVVLEGATGPAPGATRPLSGDDLVVAAHGAAVFVGRRAAVEAALGASQGKAPRLRDGSSALTKLVQRHGTDAHYVAAASIDALPDVAGETLKQRGVEFVFAAVGPELAVVLRGQPERLDALADEVAVAFAGARAALEQAEREARELPDSVRVLGFIAARHWLERTEKKLAAKVVDDELILRAPLDADLGDLAPIIIALATAAMDTLAETRRRDRTQEAKIQLARMFDLASEYFEEERIFVEVLPDGSTRAIKRHLCPNDGHERGTAGLTPSASIDCNEGPDAECVPALANAPGHYDAEEWKENPVWKALGFDQDDAHAFHYDFKYENFPGRARRMSVHRPSLRRPRRRRRVLHLRTRRRRGRGPRR